MKRVLAIGLDSVDEADLQARLAAGSSPYLAALRDRGRWCSLTVDPPCLAEHPWSDFVTALEPRHLGRWSPVTFDPADYTYGYAGAAQEPFWAQGEAATVVAFDVPSGPLARDLRGAQVVDWAAHEPTYPRCSSPTGLMAELDERFGENPAVALEYAGTWNDEAWLEEYGRSLVTSVGMRTRVIEHLLAATPGWQMAVVVYGESHQVAHHAWHGVAPDSVLAGAPTADVGGKVLTEVYRALDDAVGRLVAGLGPEDVVVVFSPKGNEALCDVPSNTLAPELFHRLAFGRPALHQPDPGRWERRGRPPVLLPGGMNYVGAMDAWFGDRPRRLARLRLHLRRAAFAAASAVAPGPFGRWRLRRRRRPRHPWVAPDPTMLQPIAGDLLYDRWYVATWYRPWWPQMDAFVLPSFSDLHVRINLVGREASGKVAIEDYERACDEVEQTLLACTNPRTGNPLVADVMRPRGSDPFAEVGVAADVVISWSEDTDALEHPEGGVVGPYPAWRSGTHGARAFALFAGGDVAPGRVTGRLVDLPVTLLSLAGIEPKAPVDGNVLPLQP